MNNNFPPFQSNGSPQRSRVNSTATDAGSSYQVVQGQDPELRPGDLRAPDWFIAVNPSEWDDSGDGEPDLNEYFEPYNVDAKFVLAQGDIEEVKRALWQVAQDSAEENCECDAGTLFAVWQLADGKVLVGALDSGGAGVGGEYIEGAVEGVAEVLQVAGVCHFDASKAVEPEYYSGISEREAVADLIKLL